jgi:hypothetical protein
MTAKGEQLQAEPGSRTRAEATVRLQRLGDGVVAACERFFEEHADALRGLDLPPDALRRLVEDMMQAFVQQDDLSPVEIPEEALQRFPVDVRILLQPE